MGRILSGEEFRNRTAGIRRAVIGVGVALMIAAGTIAVPSRAEANPYSAKPGETPVTIRVAACAQTWAYLHLYVALDNKIFDKYGIKVEYNLVRGSTPSLAALSTDEIQILYCSADATLPGLASGNDGKLVGSVLVGLSWVIVGQKDIRNPSDLNGKTIGVAHPGDLSYRLAQEFVHRFHLTKAKVFPLGGTGQVEQYNALLMKTVQASLVAPPLDVLAKEHGFNLIYHLRDLGLPFIATSICANSKTLKDRPGAVQKFVAAMADAIHFVETNPDKAKASMRKHLKWTDEAALQSAYNTYAKLLVNPKLVVPANLVAQTIEVARKRGTKIVRKPEDLFDNTFAENLATSGFLKELWGGRVPEK